MPYKGSSRRTPDLFEYTISVPTSHPLRAATPAKPPEIKSLSDPELVQDLAALIDELRRRLAKGRGSRSELEEAAKQASQSLKRLVPSPTRENKLSRSSKTSSVLQEGQRKAVRAALLAGVAPSQVAKHFRLSPATVRKVLEEAT